MEPSRSRVLHSRTLALFLLFWIVYGATTNVHNGRAYNLQQMGVDAIVAHRTFALGHSELPALKPLGDTFAYQGRILAAKQPGQFVWGAIPYTILHALGITYEKNYDLVSALVTWFSAGLFAAAAMALLDRMMWSLWGFSRRASALSTIAVGFGSYWFAYAGVAHHDILATSLIVGGLFAIEQNRVRLQSGNLKLAFGAGLLLGLAVFTSMLPSLIVLVIGVYVIVTFPMRSILWCAGGFLVGLLPLLAYNGYYFGSPFVPANVAGDFSDTFFTPGLRLARNHLRVYFGTGGLSIWRYAPAVAMGIAGLWRLPRGLRNLLVAAVAVHLFYLISIRTLGGCEYGPRYLLPLLPLLAPGVAALIDLNRAAIPAVGLLSAYGLFVSTVGALTTTMYCKTDEFALWPQMGELRQITPDQYPLRAVLFLLPLVALISVRRFGRIQQG